MACALRAWAINRRGKNSVSNLRYGPRTRLVRGIYTFCFCYRTFVTYALQNHDGDEVRILIFTAYVHLTLGHFDFVHVWSESHVKESGCCNVGIVVRVLLKQ